MSGHKRTTVKLGNQALYRIEQLSGLVRQVEQDYQEIQSAIHQQRQEQFNQLNQQMSAHQEEFQQRIGATHQEITQIEQNTSRVILDQTSVLQDQLRMQESFLLHNTQAMIDQHILVLQHALQENQAAQQAHFQALRHSISQFQNDHGRKQALAANEIEAASAMLQSLVQVYDHERYYPGAVQRIENDYERAIFNFQNGLSEAALLGAQQVSQQVSILRFGIEEILQKTALLQSVALEKSRELDFLIKRNTFVPAVDLEGRVLDTQIDVDHWSGGKLRGLLLRSEGFLRQLQTTYQELDYDDINRILIFVLPQLEKSLQDIVAQARLKVLMSQIRFNIAECIIEALGEQGFETQQAVYQGNDERKSYQVIARNLEGSEVQVSVDSGEQINAYQIAIDSFEAVPCSEGELRQRASEVLDSLKSRGLSVGETQEYKPAQNAGFVVQSRQPLTSRSYREPAHTANPYVD